MKIFEVVENFIVTKGFIIFKYNKRTQKENKSWDKRKFS